MSKQDLEQVEGYLLEAKECSDMISDVTCNNDLEKATEKSYLCQATQQSSANAKSRIMLAKALPNITFPFPLAPMIRGLRVFGAVQSSLRNDLVQ